ncbi:MAG: HalOD1 output domain-containing protein [Halobacteriota archaeon]|uniref:HalOD1 output domain-containing protein n=1 Tax=Natronomonas sp. TaxID=2184060 RepID=UPI0039749D0B
MEYEIEAGESISTAVARAVSAVEGCEPRSLRPLAEVLDPDALDTLFGSRADGTSRSGGHLTFVYSKCRITVDNGEYLTLQPIDPRICNDATEKSNTTDSGDR